MARIEPWARSQPDKVALRLAETGEAVTYRELDARATRTARWLISLGLESGDGIALLMENHVAFMELVFAARRAGVYFTPISIHLSAGEIAYVLEDCGAKVLIATAGVADLAAQLGDVIARRAVRCFMVDAISQQRTHRSAGHLLASSRDTRSTLNTFPPRAVGLQSKSPAEPYFPRVAYCSRYHEGAYRSVKRNDPSSFFAGNTSRLNFGKLGSSDSFSRMRPRKSFVCQGVAHRITIVTGARRVIRSFVKLFQVVSRYASDSASARLLQ